MLDKVIENNRVCIIGEVVSEFTFSHEVFGEGFYIANVSVNRLSDMVDIIPLMISERLIDVTKDYRGRKIEVSGQFRSYNRHEGVKNKLVLSIFVRELRFIEDDEVPEEQSKSNQIFLDGYIPCIAWGRNARFAGVLEVGSHLQICGRVQSREYTKKIGEEEVEKRVAYEVSVSKIDLVEDEE